MMLAAAAVSACLLLAAGVCYGLGVRWFVVATPSMGQTAPVGTFVVTGPSSVSALAVGDLVSFHPGGRAGAVYTHRVVHIDTGQSDARTRGDVNASDDPWPLVQRDLVGRVVIALPGVGWLVRLAPPLGAGILLIWLLTRPVHAVPWRRAIWNLGISAVLSALLSTARPLANVETITAQQTPNGLLADVISTGVLPVRVEGIGQTAHLSAGSTAQVLLARAGTTDFAVATSLDLPVWGWGLLAAFCLTPLALGIAAGLRRPRGRPQS